jgi:hypothetical protein
MSQTNKVAPPASPQQQRTPLSSVKRERVKSPWIVVIHGMPGIGKSSFAAQMPEPIFICAETHGADELDVGRYPDKIGSWSDLRQAIRRLADEEHSFKTVVIDTIDEIEELAWRSVVDRDKKGAESIEDVGGGWQKGYRAAISDWRGLLADFERLIAKRGMNVCLIAHTTRRTFKNPLGENYQRWEPNVHELASQLLIGWAKEVLFFQLETFAVRADEKSAAKGVTSGVRVIRTVDSAAYVAKNRHSLPDPLPLDYAAFSVAMEARQVAPPDEIRASILARLAEIADERVTAAVTDDITKAGEDAELLAKIDNRVATTLRKRREA